MVKHDALRIDARTFRKYTGESGVGDGVAGWQAGKQRVASTAQRLGLTDMATDLNGSCGESQEFLPDGFSTALKHVE